MKGINNAVYFSELPGVEKASVKQHSCIFIERGDLTINTDAGECIVQIPLTVEQLQHLIQMATDSINGAVPSPSK